MGFPGSSAGRESACNAGDQVRFLGWGDPLEKGQATHFSWASLGGSVGKESACNAGNLGSIPRLGKPPARGHDNPLQYPCLENPYGQGNLVGCSPQGHKESDTTE